jgi:hypothetical protein
MPERKLSIVKRTPIALGFCQACHIEFNSKERIEDDAEEELRMLFSAHVCNAEENIEPQR